MTEGSIRILRTAAFVLAVLLCAGATPTAHAQSPAPTPTPPADAVPPGSQEDEWTIDDIRNVRDVGLLAAVIVTQVLGAIYGRHLLKTAAAKEDLLKTTYEQQIALMEERLALESAKCAPLQELLEQRDKLLEAERVALRREREQILPPEASLPQEVSLTEEDRRRLDELTRRIDGIERLSVQAVPDPAADRPTKSADDYFSDGKGYYALGRYEEALAAYKRAVELDPNCTNFHISLGNVYANLNQYEEALAAYRRVIELDPAQALPHIGVGIIYWWTGRYKESLAAYQRAVELNPKLATPHTGLGHVYHSLGQYEEALASYRRAVELDPDRAFSHNGLGNVYRQLGRHEEALAAYGRAIELDPDHAAFHLGLAGLHRRLGNEEQSQHHLVTARRLVDPGSHYDLARLASFAGDAEAALAHLEKTLEKKPGLRVWARRDPDLDFVRDDARFRELVGEG